MDVQYSVDAHRCDVRCVRCSQPAVAFVFARSFCCDHIVTEYAFVAAVCARNRMSLSITVYPRAVPATASAEAAARTLPCVLCGQQWSAHVGDRCLCAPTRWTPPWRFVDGALIVAPEVTCL